MDVNDLDEENLNNFLSNIRYIKNGNPIPYISKYDYKMYDVSNNILLKSNIDTDVFFDIYNKDSNYNSNRRGNVYVIKR